MLAVTASDFAFGYVAWVFFGWFYIYLAEARGLNLKSSALYSMLPFVGMTTGCLLGGVLSDWLARRFNPRFGRCILPAICMIGTGTLLTMGARTAQASAAALILSCGVGLLYIAQSCFWVFTADFAGEFAGVASGMMNMGGQIGGACTASLTPLIASHFGWEASFLFAALLSVCGGTAWLLVNPHRNLSHIASSAEYAGDRKGHT
jgi:ACS family glucarate transporter-like MFS transporter